MERSVPASGGITEQMDTGVRDGGAGGFLGTPGGREHLFDAWLPVVVRWCNHLGGRGVDAEDAAHDVFIIVLRRYDQVYDEAHLPAWLFGITRRVLAQHRRRSLHRRHQRLRPGRELLRHGRGDWRL